MAAPSSDDEPIDEEMRMYSEMSPGNEEMVDGTGNYEGNGGHQCSVCLKMFVSMKGLVQHSIIHTDRKPFECEICHKSFRFKSNLFEHRSIHSGEQPFVCPFCGKTCRLKGNLKKHLKTHVRDPNEIEQAYEAVTSTQLMSGSGASLDYSEHAEYADDGEEEHGDGASNRTPARPKRRFTARTPFQLKREFLVGTAANVLIKVLQDENTEPTGNALYPPLSEMINQRFTTDEFIRAARAMPFEKYQCRACQITFSCRFDMEDHCENAHDVSRRLANKEKKESIFWCDLCLREFDDQKTFDQHTFFHRRIRALINKGELHVKEPTVATYFTS